MNEELNLIYKPMHNLAISFADNGEYIASNGSLEIEKRQLLYAAF
jgi:hypothetical protein